MQTIDRDISFEIYQVCHTTPLNPVFQLISLSGDGLLWFPLPFVLYLVNYPLSPLLHILFSSIICALVELLIKQSLKRPRPFYDRTSPRFIAAEHYSCPSGHSIRSVYLSFLFSSLFPSLSTYFYLWAALVCFSRVVVGRHHALDCVFGAFIGLVVYVFAHNWIHSLTLLFTR